VRTISTRAFAVDNLYRRTDAGAAGHRRSALPISWQHAGSLAEKTAFPPHADPPMIAVAEKPE
jgi:hypothetical protein